MEQQFYEINIKHDMASMTDMKSLNKWQVRHRWAMQAEKLCLRWNDFQQNLSNAFGGFRGDTDFTYVTLACEDGTQVEAHKVILSASSPLFKKLAQKWERGYPYKNKPKAGVPL